MNDNRFPKLHNAMWPGLVGKGSPGAEPCLDFDTMLGLTAAAEVNGVKFDGVDIFLFAPHIDIDSTDDDLKRIADKILAKDMVVGSVVAPIWAPTGGGSAMGSRGERKRFVGQVRKGCRIAAKLRELGARPYGVVRIDTACSVTDWDKDPAANTRLIAQTLREAAAVAEGFGERLAAEGEICWGAMHSWRKMVDLLEQVGRPQTVGFQADMAHTLLYVLGYNAPEDRIVPAGFNWEPEALDGALRQLTAALRPWTIDFHVAQNDATVHGSGTHDQTGRHCLVNDPHGKLDPVRHSAFWLRDGSGQLTRAFRHLCWDGCMFPNAVMMKPETWNNILAAMVAVRNAHGWAEEEIWLPALGAEGTAGETVAEVFTRVVKKEARSRRAKAKKVAPPAPRAPRQRPAAGKKPPGRLASKTSAKARMKAAPQKARKAAPRKSRGQAGDPAARRRTQKPKRPAAAKKVAAGRGKQGRR